MGIVRFFNFWVKDKFSTDLYPVKKRDGNMPRETGVQIDTLCIDLNGMYHPCAQYVYRYGNFSDAKHLLKPVKKRPTLNQQLQVFEKVCADIDELVRLTQPRKGLLLFGDGVSGCAKMTQQRQRRYRTGMERGENNESFDPNSISPGTKFMNFLGKYMDWYIRKKISSDWSHLEVLLSTDKENGEGEHKIFKFIKENPRGVYCVHGLDADLIMLSLATHYPHIYILRDDMSIRDNYLLLNMSNVYNKIIGMMFCGDDPLAIDSKTVINDFVLIGTMVGNDFLKHMPSVEIIEGGLDVLLDIYRNVVVEKGHLTFYDTKRRVRLNTPALELFYSILGEHEKEMIERKASSGKNYFEDPVLDKHLTLKPNGEYTLDLDAYKLDYYRKMGTDPKQVCTDYLEGVQWVLSYYCEKIPSWTWCYPHHYAPFASDVARFITEYEPVEYTPTKPVPPLLQLLCVLPPTSANLLPAPLDELLDSNSPIGEFCPEEVEVDLAGKRAEWEGVVKLPMVDIERVRAVYNQWVKRVDKRFIPRDEKTRKYTYNPRNIYMFQSFYGNIDSCMTDVREVESKRRVTEAYLQPRTKSRPVLK